MEWYYANNDERRGPIADGEFQVLVSNGTIRPSTLVWRQGMADWSPYASLTGGIANYSGEVGMRYAGFWIRFVAKFIDGVLLTVVSFIFQMPISIAIAMTQDESAALGLQLLNLAVSFLVLILTGAYHTIFVGWKGATPGKMALGLRIVRANGQPVGYGLALGRWVAAALNYLTFMIGWMMAGWTREKTGLHDLICDTRVIRVD